MISVIIPSWRPAVAEATIALATGLEVNENQYLTPYGDRLGVLQSMAKLAEGAEGDLLMFIHDDVEILEEGWDIQVEEVFRLHPGCGLAGFGGALGLGDPDLYKTPYRLQQLARHTFLSNMKEAEIHGIRTNVVQRISVLDGFCQIFADHAYHAMGGWRDAIDGGMPPHHMYDAWAACRMKELEYQTWLIPVTCHHRGGETATGRDYHEWLKTQGYADDTEVHQIAHRVLYERFRDVLPLTV